MNLFTQLNPDWRQATPEELLDAPVTALRGFDGANASLLRDVLGVTTVRELALQPVALWVWQAFGRFRVGVQRELPEDAAEYLTEAWQGRSTGDWLASPLTSLRALDEEQARRLGEALGWVTVRHLANDTGLAAAREIARIVTGEPKAPDEDVVKPLPNYFAGGTQRFLNRKREDAGLPPRATDGVPPPPPPPPPQATEALREARAAASAELPAEGDLPPAMAANLGTPTQAMPPMPARQRKEYTPDGVYIPRGGGSRGWLNSQGIARIERPNRYGYEHAVDWETYERAGMEEQVRQNLRGAERMTLKMQVRWNEDPDAQPIAGLCLDISLTGARLRLGQALRKGRALTVTWVNRDDDLGDEQALLTLAAAAVWNKSVNPAYRTPRYDCGVEFGPMSLDAQRRLTLLMTNKVADLMEMGPPVPEEEQAPRGPRRA